MQWEQIIYFIFLLKGQCQHNSEPFFIMKNELAGSLMNSLKWFNEILVFPKIISKFACPRCQWLRWHSVCIADSESTPCQLWGHGVDVDVDYMQTPCPLSRHLVGGHDNDYADWWVNVVGTEVKQLGPWLALGWVTIQGLDVDAVATNTVKSKKQRNRASIICFWGKKS